MTQTGESYLKIKDATQAETGTYICVASNTEGQEEAAVFTVVKSKFFFPQRSQGYQSQLPLNLSYFLAWRRLPGQVPCTIGKGEVGQAIMAA